MKLSLCIATFLTLSIGALAQSSPAPSGSGTPANEPDESLGQTSCPQYDAEGNELEPDICEFYEECHTSKNKTHSKCIRKGNIVCNEYSKLGTSGNIIGAMECLPYQTCCDGKCCSGSCVEAHSGTQGPDATFSYDFNELIIDEVARNDWKTPKGETIENKPRKCVLGASSSTLEFDATAGFRAVEMPALCLFTVFVIFVQTLRKSQEGIIDMIPPLVVIGTSFFLVLSFGWKMALMATFVAAATTSSGPENKKWVVLFQVFFLWYYFGGSNGLMFTQNSRSAGPNRPEGQPENFFVEAAEQDLLSLSGECSTFYGYYKLDPKQLEWYQDPSDESLLYTGLCGVGFQGALVFCAYVQATFLFIMTVLTTVSYLNPGDANAQETKNPASQVEMSQ